MVALYTFTNNCSEDRLALSELKIITDGRITDEWTCKVIIRGSFPVLALLTSLPYSYHVH